MKSPGSLFFCLLALVSSQVWGDPPAGTAAFTAYNPNYFIAGIGDMIEPSLYDWSDIDNPILRENLQSKQLFKLGFSMKFQFISDLKSGVFLGYTQTMFWDLLAELSPFVEINYQPELFFRFRSKDNFLDDVDMGILDYFQFGFLHKSNGMDGPSSRSYNKAYSKIQLGVGEELRFELWAMAYAYLDPFFLPEWAEQSTQDIIDYRSNWQFGANFTLPFWDLFFLPKDIKLSFGPGGGPLGWDFFKGWIEANVRFGAIIPGLYPFVQGWAGYGEGLIAYNKENLSLRVGLTLN